MTGAPAPGGVRAILLDIEGTTTPIAFVTEVLFPYARRHVRSHLDRHASSPEYERLLARLKGEHQQANEAGEEVPVWTGDPASALDGAVVFVEWLMDRDRKSTELKELQGKIWEDGYRRGELAGAVFPDVAAAFACWRDRGLDIGIFSSGSVLAQQLLFRHSSAGDLTPFVRWHFDTHTGAKVDPESYRRIAETMGLPTGDVLFLSDVTRELDAARAAGMQTRLVVRPGNAPVAPGHGHEPIETLSVLSRV